MGYVTYLCYNTVLVQILEEHMFHEFQHFCDFIFKDHSILRIIMWVDTDLRLNFHGYSQLIFAKNSKI